MINCSSSGNSVMLALSLWMSSQDWRPDLSPAYPWSQPCLLSWLFCHSKYTFPLEAYTFWGLWTRNLSFRDKSEFILQTFRKKSCLVLLVISIQSTCTETLVCIHQCWLRKLLRQQFSYSKSLITWTRVCNSYAVFSNSYNNLVQYGECIYSTSIYLGLSFIKQQ